MQAVVPPGADWIAGALALEAAAGAAPAARTLPAEAMASLADHVAHDLSRLLPGVESLGLALAGALFDQAQLLRPGWPAFASLAALHRRQVAGGDPAAIVAFGSSAGTMVDAALVPEPGTGDASLLLLPFVLRGEPTLLAEVGARMERELDERGLAAAATALFLGEALSMRVEHARYLTRDDLCALCALQLEHAGLDQAWLLIESALFPPGSTREAVAPAGQHMRLAGNGVELELRDAASWARGPGRDCAVERRDAGFLDWQREQRRLCALFGAHGLPVGFRHPDTGEHVPPGQPYWLCEPGPRPPPEVTRALFLHAAADLGVVAITAAAREGASWRPLACGYPLAPQGPEALRQALQQGYDCPGAPRAVRLELDPRTGELLLRE